MAAVDRPLYKTAQRGGLTPSNVGFTRFLILYAHSVTVIYAALAN